MLALALCYEQDAGVLIMYAKLNINFVSCAQTWTTYIIGFIVYMCLFVFIWIYLPANLSGRFLYRGRGAGFPLCIMSPS